MGWDGMDGPPDQRHGGVSLEVTPLGKNTAKRVTGKAGITDDQCVKRSTTLVCWEGLSFGYGPRLDCQLKLSPHSRRHHSSNEINCIHQPLYRAVNSMTLELSRAHKPKRSPCPKPSQPFPICPSREISFAVFQFHPPITAHLSRA